jgi:hypothetical protein
MREGRDLRQEIDGLNIVVMEDFGSGSPESAFAAIDAIREHNRQYPEEKLAEMIEDAHREAYEAMAGTKNRKGDN